MDAYQPATKRGRASKRAAEKGVIKLHRRAEKPARKAKETKPATGAAAMRGLLDSGFFDEPHTFVDIRRHLNKSGLVFSDRGIKANLTRMTKAHLLSTSGRGRVIQYYRPQPA